jgi:molecular chaperone DnaJ
MNDPYTTLGVSRNASDEQVKTAYRELAKKYHPDNYADNPLADLASEKMKEINEAYDAITKSRSSGGGYASGSSSSSYSGSSSTGYSGSSSRAGSGSARYQNIRSMIDKGMIGQAQSGLDAVPLNQRDAEWHYLMGSIMYRKGWTNEAYTNFQNAYRMEPSNPEYRQAVERISQQMNRGGFAGGFGGYNGGQMEGCNGMDLCTTLMCANCLCGGCGGGGC